MTFVDLIPALVIMAVGGILAAGLAQAGYEHDEAHLAKLKATNESLRKANSRLAAAADRLGRANEELRPAVERMEERLRACKAAKGSQP